MPEDHPISSTSPVDELPLIGDARTAALARIGIYSVGDFMSRTVTATDVVEVSRMTGLSASEIDRIRSAVPTPRRFRIHLRRVLPATGLATGLTLIAIGLIIELDTFHLGVFPSARVIVLRSDVPGTLASTESVIASTVESIEFMRTRVVVRTSAAFGNPIGSLPKAIIVHGTGGDARLSSVVSRVTFIETEAMPADERGWLRDAEVRRHISPVPVVLHRLQQNETIPAPNLVVKLIPPPAPPAFKVSRMTTETEVVFHQRLSTKWFDTFRDGMIAVHVTASAHEAQPGKGIIRRNLGKVVIPVFDMGPLEPIRSEYTWRTNLKGGFEGPDSMVAAKQFWSHEPVVSESFHYRVRGAKYLTYLAQIVGWPLLASSAFALRGRRVSR